LRDERGQEEREKERKMGWRKEEEGMGETE